MSIGTQLSKAEAIRTQPWANRDNETRDNIRENRINNKVGQTTSNNKGTGTYVGSGAQAQYQQYTELRNTAIMVGHKADLNSLSSFLVRAVWYSPSFAYTRLMQSKSTSHA